MKLTVETLAHAISNFIDSYESTDARTILRDEFRLTDNEIRDMGFDYLFDIAEPAEPQKKKWKVHIRETWEGDFEVEAADWDEAYALACDLEYASGDLDYTNREVEIEEQIKFSF